MLKVAVIGGGSSYTPELIKGFLDRVESFPIDELWLVDISQEQEMALGLQSYDQILSQSRVVTQGKMVETVRNIGQRIAKAAADVDPGFQWEFNVIASEQVNAFALPGGKVAVYTGILPVAENTDDT